MENEEDNHIQLNEDEFVDSLWLNPREAVDSLKVAPVDGQTTKEFKLFFPQQMGLLWLSQFTKYDDLKSMLQNHLDKMMLSYMEFRGNVFVNNEKFIPEGAKLKTLEDYYKFVFNKYDFLPDRERKEKQGLMVINDINNFGEVNGAKEVLSLVKDSGSAIFDHHKCHSMFLLPGDFYHSNEIYPWRTREYSRHRCYIKKDTIIRYEISKDVHEHFSNKDAWDARFISDFTNPEEQAPKMHKI